MNFFSLLGCFLLLPLTIKAQVDGHYWTHQYGARGLLMNGAVIASPEGETALYYNPGAAGMDENLGFELSFITPTYSLLRKKNLLNKGNLIEDDGLNYAPGFLGARFKPFASEKFTAGITSFSRLKSNINLSDRVIDKVEGTDALLYRGDLNFSRRVNEVWIGVSLAYNVTDNLGVGLTQFSTWHSQSSNLDFKKEIIPTSGPSTIIQSWRSEFGYGLSEQSSFVSKLGLAYRSEKIRLGLTVTSPSYGSMRRRGSYLLEDHRVNILTSESTTVSNRAGTRKIDKKSPLSMGFGLDVLGDGLNFSISTEYFFGIQEYSLLQVSDDPFDGKLPFGSQIEEVNLKESADNVLNVAVAIQSSPADSDNTYFVGFRTDLDQKNVVILDNFPNYLGSIGNVFHLSGGGLFTFGENNRLSIGMDIGYGRQSGGLQLADLADIDQSNIFEFNGSTEVTSTFFSTMIFCTYDFIITRFK